MFWIDLLLVAVFAAVFSSILAWGFGWRHPSGPEAIGVSVLFLFLVLLFAMWAGAAWLPRWGPEFYGTSWLTLLLVGLFISLLLLAVSAPVRRSRAPAPPSDQAKQEAAATSAVAATFGMFFWILIVGLLGAGIASYFL